MTWRAAGLAIVLAVTLGPACGDTSVQPQTAGSNRETTGSKPGPLAPGPFRLVDHEDVYLNGSGNDDRPPISFHILEGRDSAAQMAEAELVTAYVAALRQDGWRIDPYSTDKDWWQFYGGRGSDSIRVGAATRFVAMARADEGYARPKFRRIVAGTTHPLVVASVDPRD